MMDKTTSRVQESYMLSSSSITATTNCSIAFGAGTVASRITSHHRLLTCLATYSGSPAVAAACTVAAASFNRASRRLQSPS